MATITSTVNPFTIPSNCNKDNPSPAYPAIKALSIYFFEEEDEKKGMSFEEWKRREHLAYAALEEFFTEVLSEEVEDLLRVIWSGHS